MEFSAAAPSSEFPMCEQDKFTPEFKRLKARKPPPNLENVVDLDLISSNESACPSIYDIDKHETLFLKHFSVTKNDLEPVTGLKSCEEWTVFQFLSNPGFFVILNPFVDGFQRYWVSRCVQDFPSHEANVTNMSAQEGFNYPEMWEEFKKRSTFEKNEPLRKLRWTTLGYHYDWNTKEYSESNKAPFPPDVGVLSQYIASALGFGPYQAEAGIVNYYHMDSTLAGHTDHSELDQAAPLLSISFGQTAIFLLGGETKSVKPTALYLRSGDICVMSGPSRLAYHAVPKILLSGSTAAAQNFKDAFTFSEQLPAVQEVSSFASNSSDSSCISIVDSVADKADVVSERFGVDKKAPNGADESTSGFSETDSFTSSELIMQTSDQPNFSVSNVPFCDEVCEQTGVQPNSSSSCASYTSDYASNLKAINSQILKTVSSLDFTPFERYLASSRINLNIRQVLPPGCKALPSKMDSTVVCGNKRLKTCDS